MDSIDLLAGRVANVLTAFAPFERPPSYFGVRFRFLPLHMLGDDDYQSEDEDEVSVGEPLNESVDHSEEDTNIKDKEESENEDDKNGGSEEEESRPESDEGFVTLRFETYHEDPKKIWMEVAMSFRSLDQPGFFDSSDIDIFSDNIRETYKFVSERSKRFLDQFDKPNPSSGGEQ
jgi:hypothetical protein